MKESKIELTPSEQLEVNMLKTKYLLDYFSLRSLGRTHVNAMSTLTNLCATPSTS